jgi:hypothetical protein
VSSSALWAETGVITAAIAAVLTIGDIIVLHIAVTARNFLIQPTSKKGALEVIPAPHRHPDSRQACLLNGVNN